uniref:Midkine n=3 Tax=Canis lupus TaxID=9612 RepID=A0A8C0NBN2_CANLF
MQLRGFLLLALPTLLALPAAVAKKKDKVTKGGPGERVRGVDLGALHPQQQGLRRGFPRGYPRGPDPAHPVPGALQLKKEFGADCKYEFENWGACDRGSGTKARQGTLKKARYNAQCQETIRATKPCTPKTKAKAKAKKGKGKD